MNGSLTCYLCGRGEFREREGRVRDNRDLRIIECLSCGLVFLSSFDHIHGSFYKEGRMHENPVDIDSLLKVTFWDDERRFAFLKRFIENKTVLDFGCGAGGFLMRARSAAARVAGVEIESRLQPYFQKEELEIYADLKCVKDNFEIITVFHVLEHMPDPVKVLGQLAEKLGENGRLIVEVPSADDALLKLYASRPFSQFTYWSCHLFLFTKETISAIAEKSGLKVDYIKQVQRYPISNHLYWLAKGEPGGHKAWSFLDSEELNRAYEKQLASLGLCDTIMASFSK